MVEENCQLFSLPISLFYAPRMKFFTVSGYLRIDELIIKTGYPCFQSGEDGRTVPSRYPAGSWRERKPRSARGVGGKRRGEGEGRARDRWSLPVACRLPSTVDAVYSSSIRVPTRVCWLCRSFGLGREALTSAFHSGSTTGHVDHSLLRNTYLRASSSSSSSPSSPLRHSSLSLFLSHPFASILFDIIRIYTHTTEGMYASVLRLRKRSSKRHSFLLSPTRRTGGSLFLYIDRYIELTVHNHRIVGERVFLFGQRHPHGDYVKGGGEGLAS